MKTFTVILLACLLNVAPIFAAPKIQIDSIKVVVTEKGKSPVNIAMPYWVAKSGAEISDKLSVGTEEIPMKQIVQIIDKAPRLGPIMTIEKGQKKIVISIQ